MLSILTMLTSIIFYEITEVEPLTENEKKEIENLNFNTFYRLEKDYDYLAVLLDVEPFDLQLKEIENLKSVEGLEDSKEKIIKIMNGFGIEEIKLEEQKQIKK